MPNYTIAEIDLSVLNKNIRIINSVTNGVKLLGIVKANAYGHGLEEISKALERFGVYALGVANVDEGVRIREAGIKLPVLVLFQHFKDECGLVCRYNLNPIISNDECLHYYDRYLKNKGQTLNLYIKIDTGLNRMGVRPEDALDLAKKVLSYNTLKIEGISTHYAAADMNDDNSLHFTERQIRIFNDVLNNLTENGIKINNAHSANSAAIISYKDAYFDMVRAGIILYGYSENFYDLGIKPILSLKSKVVLIRNIKKGESISYGMTWTAEKDTRAAVIPIGYADGLSRRLSNNWEVKINGKYYPLRGRVCMDFIIAEIGSSNINIEDEVLIFGNDEKLNAETLAIRIGSISHEVLANIGDRVKRVYEYS
ncbi:alanine racemase [uncultured Brachyspira sp.]|uniref:alanine racemase n=1 Tax=uncultured Brachyspira sp. TaxID=221953 RepID=UPI0025F4D973|nr:alanine racemase [uncultured Brachyspira sp.]